MDSTSHERPGRKMAGWILDAALPAGLLLALFVAWGIDRLVSKKTAVQAPVDLVFVLDQGRGMMWLVDSVKTNCLEKAAALQAGGADCRFATIPFGRGMNLLPEIPLTGDLAVFKQQLMDTPAAGAAAGPVPPVESSAEALRRALNLDFRPGATVFFFLITNTPCQQGDELARIAEQMDQRRIRAIVQADAAEQTLYRPLYQGGGRFFTIEGQDVTEPEVAARGGEQPDAGTASLLTPITPGAGGQNSTAALGAKGLYSLRTVQQRDRWIAMLGGSSASELAVREGLAWLARHQADDGHWSDEGKCEQEQRCAAIKYGATVAETGLAVLAFQAGGNYNFNGQQYSDHVTRGLDYLVEQQKPDGRLFGPVQTWYEHGIATFALAEACAVAIAEERTPNARYLSAAQKAVAFMESHQYRQGGWQYALDSGGCGDTSVTGWQVLALKSALEAQISVAPETMQQVQQFYEQRGDPNTGLTGYSSRGGGTDLTTAVGLIVQEFILKQPDSPLAQKAIEHLGRRADAGIGRTGDFYTLYNATLSMFLAGGDPWQRWNSQVRDAVVQRQVKAGCERGSWTDNYKRTLGTAWAVLTLEVYYRYAMGPPGGGPGRSGASH